MSMIAPQNLLVLVFGLLIGQSTARTSDIYGNLIMENEGRYPSSTCCIVPTCNRPLHCYKTMSCGHLCKTGMYPPADYGTTPGYQLKTSYSRYECMFGECRMYEMSCHHCQEPTEPDFNILLARDDCKECYQRLE